MNDNEQRYVVLTRSKGALSGQWGRWWCGTAEGPAAGAVWAEKMTPQGCEHECRLVPVGDVLALPYKLVTTTVEVVDVE